MKKRGLKGSVIFLSVDFNPTNINDILDIHKYLIKKHNKKQCSVTLLMGPIIERACR